MLHFICDYLLTLLIGIRGYPTRTNPKTKQGSGDFSGELSIAAVEVVLLSPCLHQVSHCYRGIHKRSPSDPISDSR